jgi:ferritin-like protein
MASESLHESAQQLRPETIDRHRAVSSLMEELEAVDWYDQRVDAATDMELKQILAHNRDEEKEHATMVLEWLRRRDPKLDEHLRTYLFTDKPLLEIEAEIEHGGGAAPKDKGVQEEGCLNIGSLRGQSQGDRRGTVPDSQL